MQSIPRNTRFLSTPSARRATGGRSPRHQDQGFLSTPSARRATGLRAGWCFANLFLSTPSARRATTCPPSSRRSARISIHALREEGDAIPGTGRRIFSNFYPRPPRGGRRRRYVLRRFWQQFLSTPSARRATSSKFFRCFDPDISIHALREEGDRFRLSPSRAPANFYPRPPRGGRLGRVKDDIKPNQISIHALREEGDVNLDAASPTGWNFYPRPPRGGRPVLTSGMISTRMISIHALREEGDAYSEHRLDGTGHFYPRPPRGGRPFQIQHQRDFHKFLSTPSARRATSHRPGEPRGPDISIHALREEGDFLLLF